MHQVASGAGELAAENSDLGGKFLTLWSFLAEFCSQLGVHPCGFPEVLDALTIGSQSLSLVNMHIGLMRFIQAEAESAHTAISHAVRLTLFRAIHPLTPARETLCVAQTSWLQHAAVACMHRWQVSASAAASRECGAGRDASAGAGDAGQLEGGVAGGRGARLGPGHECLARPPQRAHVARGALSNIFCRCCGPFSQVQVAWHSEYATNMVGQHVPA